MLANNFPCTCGHSKINHILPSLGCGVKYCPCDIFAPDNLRYLEKKHGTK